MHSVHKTLITVADPCLANVLTRGMLKTISFQNDHILLEQKMQKFLDPKLRLLQPVWNNYFAKTLLQKQW